jgi:sigma-E factor negative regulatory protein RseA
MSDKTMKIENEEKLSALVDSELSNSDLTQTLAQLGASKELRSAWDRYHLIGDAIRGEGIRVSAEGVAPQVRERLDKEPAMLVRPTPINQPQQRERLSRPLVGAALAASVAAVAVFMLPRMGEEIPGSAPAQVASERPVPLTYARQGGTRWKNLAEPKLESKLNRYLENHSEHASSGGMGVVPYSSFVSYDASSGKP